MANIKSTEKENPGKPGKNRSEQNRKDQSENSLKKAEAAIESGAADKDVAVKLAVKKSTKLVQKVF